MPAAFSSARICVDLGDHPGGQPHGRLVQHQEAGAGHEGPADGQDLLLAAGKGARGLVGPLLEDGEALPDFLQVPAHLRSCPGGDRPPVPGWR